MNNLKITDEQEFYVKDFMDNNYKAEFNLMLNKIEGLDYNSKVLFIFNKIKAEYKVKYNNVREFEESSIHFTENNQDAILFDLVDHFLTEKVKKGDLQIKHPIYKKTKRK